MIISHIIKLFLPRTNTYQNPNLIFNIHYFQNSSQKNASDIALKSVLHVRQIKPTRMSDTLQGLKGPNNSSLESSSSKRCLFDEKILSDVSGRNITMIAEIALRFT